MKIYRKEDFKDKGYSPYSVFVPGYLKGETEKRHKERCKELFANCGVEPFFETDEKIELFKVYCIDGEFYLPCIVGSDRCLVDTVDFDEYADGGSGESDLRCPYCGELIDDVHEAVDEFECPSCGSKFDIEVQMTYNTIPVKSAEVIDI